MRITLVNPYMLPVPGGIEKELVHIANEFCRQGDQVNVVTTDCMFPEGRVKDDRCTLDIDPRVRTVRLRGYFRNRLKGFQPSNAPLVIPKLTAQISAQRPDGVIFFNIGWPVSVLVPLLRLRQRVPILYRTYYHSIRNGRHQRLRGKLALKVAQLSHFLVTATEAEKQYIIEDGNTDRLRIAVIPPGISVHEIGGSEIDEFKDKYNLHNKSVVIHVGRLGSYKGTDKVIRAVGNCASRTSKELRVLLVGRVMEGTGLIRLVKEMGLEKNVMFLGAVSERQLHVAYASSDVFVLPSLYESFGFVYLEAMSQGIPVIGVNTGGVSEIVKHGKNGFLIDRPSDLHALEDYVLTLTNDRDLRREMGEYGKKIVRSLYDWRTCSRSFKHLLLRVQDSL